MAFSNEMDWPDNWVASFEATSRRRLGADMPFLMVGTEDSEGVFHSLGPDAVVITNLDPKNLGIKINFENPEILSLGSQFSPDQLVIKFPNNLVLSDKAGNSLILNNGAVGKNSVDIKLNIQPQVAAESPATIWLNNICNGMKWLGLILPIMQLIWTRVFDSRIFFFLTFVVNLQNIAFIPSLGVANPGHFGLFTSNLLQAATLNVAKLNKIWNWKF